MNSPIHEPSLTSQYWLRVDTVIRTSVGNDLVFMNLDTGKYLFLNEFATFVWDQLDAARNLAELWQVARNEFEVEETVFRRDAAQILQQMEREGLVVRHETPCPIT